jgi:hypothetical protein
MLGVAMAAISSTTGSLIGPGAALSVGPESIGLLARARGLFYGIDALVPATAKTVDAVHFLSAWTVELLLKSYLSHVGISKREIRTIQHNLDALWTKASSLGLSVSSAPPRWCQLLSGIHDSPYHSRYPTHAAAHIGPNVDKLRCQLQTLLKIVENAVQPA